MRDYSSMPQGFDAARRGAMYLRKSRADIEKEAQGHYETLAHHERELTELAGSMGLPVDDTFRELVSGESIAARTQFQALMEGVQRREYGYVLCHAVDRLGRGDMMEYGWVLSTFQYSGTKIVTPGKVYDPTDPLDLQQLQFQMLFSNVEYGRIKERLRSGRVAAVRDGQYIGSIPPYGYDKAVIDRKKTLVPNDKAPIVQEVYERIATGESMSSVCHDLTNRGILTEKGACWRPRKIKDIVQNEVYKGYVRWNQKVVAVDSRDGMALRKVRRDEGRKIVSRGLHEPIVSEELWAAAQEGLHLCPKNGKTRQLANPLAHVMVCPECGKTIRCVGSEKVHRYYRHDPYTPCECHPHRMEPVVKAVIRALEKLAGDYELRAVEDGDGVGEHEERIAKLESAIAECDRKLGRVLDIYTDGVIDIAEVRKRRAPIMERKEQLEAALEREAARIPKKPLEVAMRLRDVIRLLADDTIPAEVRNDAVMQVVERIEYTDKGDGLRLDVFLRE